MTLVFVAKDMQVGNPVGYVNVHRLPGDLPSGLNRVHLTRAAPEMVRLNLVDGASMPLVPTAEPGGSLADLEYRDHSVFSGHGRAGWVDPTYEVNYSIGYTWMVVGKTEGSDIYTTVATGEYTGPDGGEALQFREGGARLRMYRPDDGGARAFREPDPLPEGFFAAFGAVHRVENMLTMYIPHAEVSPSQPATTTDDSGTRTVGLYLNRTSPIAAAGNEARSAEMAFFASWNRPLSLQEMNTAYAKLRPWLAERDVDIP